MCKSQGGRTVNVKLHFYSLNFFTSEYLVDLIHFFITDCTCRSDELVAMSDDARDEKTDLKVFVIVIPRALFWYDTNFSELYSPDIRDYNHEKSM